MKSCNRIKIVKLNRNKNYLKINLKRNEILGIQDIIVDPENEYFFLAGPPKIFGTGEDYVT